MIPQLAQESVLVSLAFQILQLMNSLVEAEFDLSDQVLVLRMERGQSTYNLQRLCLELFQDLRSLTPAVSQLQYINSFIKIEGSLISHF